MVKCGSKFSNVLPVKIAVPQGSILGPLLLILYVNDSPTCFNYGTCHNYADDTALDSTGKSVSEVQSYMQDNLNVASQWLDQNRPKSNVMLIGNKNVVKNNSLNLPIKSTNKLH